MSAPARREASADARAFHAARDQLLRHLEEGPGRRLDFAWPRLEYFNWALDWFDGLAERHQQALFLVGKAGVQTRSFEQLRRRSNQVANWFDALGMRRGERVMILLGNSVELYETMLASIKLGLVMVPGFQSMGAAELADRLRRGRIRHVIAEGEILRRVPPQDTLLRRIAIGPARPADWLPYADSQLCAHSFAARAPTRAEEPLFGYFTSGTTSAPKLVLHSHQSYPVGHLSSMYWNGIRPGDVHLNVSPPGWAKHSWSSFFAPWNAGATIVGLAADHGAPADILAALRQYRVNTFCAPPTIWRGLLQQGLGPRPPALRELAAAGEPLDATLIEAVERAWDLPLRDGLGQSEATALIGTPPNCKARPGAVGLPLPGYTVHLIDVDSGLPGQQGEICLALGAQRPLGLMLGYDDDAERNAAALGGRYYRTGDLARRDADGYLWHLGRTDDQFKAFDYRISPVELETALLAHPSIAEAAVVPFPDPLGLYVPKAFVRLKNGHAHSGQWARQVFAFLAQRLPAELAVRRLEAIDILPKTLSGKILRRNLRERTLDCAAEYLATEACTGRPAAPITNLE